MSARISMRMLLAPTWAVALMPVMYVLVNAMNPLVGEAAVLFHSIAAISLIVGVMFHGSGRCGIHYPGANAPYAAWLSQTPWKPGRPLPLGPAHVWWQDLAVLGLVGACLAADWWNFKIEMLSIQSIVPRSYIGHGLVWLLLAFAIGFALRVGHALVAIRQWIEPVLLAAIFPLVLGFLHRPMPLLVVALMLLLIVNIGILRSLRRFPWPESRPLLPKYAWLGWPISRIGPVDLPQLPRGLGLGGAVMIGWWVYSIAEFFSRLPGRGRGLEHFHVLAWGLIGGSCFALMRLVLYSHCHAWPISPVTRVLTGRLIIPRYDCMLLAPAATALAGLITPVLCRSAGLPPTTALALTFVLVIAIAIELGPSYRSWVLTGEHRITPGNVSSDATSVTRRLSADMKLQIGAYR